MTSIAAPAPQPCYQTASDITSTIGRQMLNFDFKRNSRQCAESGEEFKPGDEFYSALVENADGTASRKDIRIDQWDGPPEDCIGWWKCRIPELDKGQVYWAPKSVLLSYFDHLHENNSQPDLTYIVALVLMQKKILISRDEDPENGLCLVSKLNKKTYELTEPEISPERLIQIQDELSEKLFTDQIEDPEDGGDA